MADAAKNAPAGSAPAPATQPEPQLTAEQLANLRKNAAELVDATRHAREAAIKEVVTVGRIKANITVHLSKQAEDEVNEPILEAVVDLVRADTTHREALKAQKAAQL